MKEHDGDVKQFIHVSRAWYGNSCLDLKKTTDQVSFGLYAPDGGTSGEMSMTWHKLGPPSDQPYAKLEIFEDSWSAFAQFPDLIARLAEVDEQKIQPAEFCEILKECGFIDNTPEKSPYGDAINPADCRSLAMEVVQESTKGDEGLRQATVEWLSKITL